MLGTVRVIRDPHQSRGVIEADFCNFEAEVIAALPGDWPFLTPGSSLKQFSLESSAAIGFPASFVLSSLDGSGRELYVSLLVGVPHNRLSSSAIVEMSPQMESASGAKKLLELSVDFWSPSSAFAGRTAVQRLLNQPPGAVRVGWVTYLSEIRAKTWLPPGVRCEQYGPGILIYASDSPGYEDDVKSLDSMRRTIDSLAAQDFLRGHAKPPQTRKSGH
jgi:hypothetical protein